MSTPPSAAKETEAGFTTAVVNLAKLYGWLVYHALPLRTARGWATGTQGDPGLPDIVATKGGRVVFAELKVGRNPTTEAQDAWLSRLAAVPAAEVFVWRPADWPAIEATFKGQ